MSEKPVLAIMAAGMGSRYGGLKQIDPIGPNGELIIDYSIYDAIQAGFERVVFIIKHEIERDFCEVVGERMKKNIEVSYAFQELAQLPDGFAVPEGRVKPWGTTHAVLAARASLTGPFAVINADDYYGPSAFKTIYDWLSRPQPADARAHYCMVGYRVGNTLSATGSVTRGVCSADDRGYLTRIDERRTVERGPNGARYTEDGGATWIDIPSDTLVSMNIWGLDARFMEEAARDFRIFLEKNLPVNPLKCEDILPVEIDAQIQTGRADVQVLESRDVWYGVTYKEDRATVTAAMAEKHAQGQYPTPLWG